MFLAVRPLPEELLQCLRGAAPVRVFLHPTGLHSRAMVRVANALTMHAPRVPPSFQLVATPQDADLQILHVISYDAVEYAAQILARGGRYAVIQYCLGHPTEILWDAWRKLWVGADLVWSYYPLHEQAGAEIGELGVPLYYAPLGVDEPFQAMSKLLSTPGNWPARTQRIITTGYVNGDRAEPIYAVWKAAELARIDAVHIGPQIVEGMPEYPRRWRTERPGDMRLAEIYATSTWVSGLRHVEGFELPAAEGLVCGARPIVFDQPSMREWYGEHAVYISETPRQVPEMGISDLVTEIAYHLAYTPRGVDAEERERALERFNWETIAKGFWEALLR